MERSDACEGMAKLMIGGHYQYEEEAALALQIFVDSLEDGDDPAMALALAKNLNYEATHNDKGNRTQDAP